MNSNKREPGPKGSLQQLAQQSLIVIRRHLLDQELKYIYELRRKKVCIVYIYSTVDIDKGTGLYKTELFHRMTINKK